MKKQNFSKLIAATVATSAIVVPTAALAADTTTAQSGVYFAAQGKFYTFDQLAGIPIAELSLLLTDNSKVFIYTAGVGTASLTQIAASNGSYITAANLNGNTANPEKVIPSGVYTDKNNNKITLTGNTSPVGDLKVESVSAINPTTIKVTFDKDLTAANLAASNFTLSKGTVEGVTTEAGNAKVAIISVKGLTYGDKSTVTVGSPAFTKEVTVPAVSDLFTLEIATDATNDTILSNGASKTQVTVTLKDKTTGAVVNKDGIVQFQATNGGLGQTTSALVNGKASVQLTSEASATSITSILTATISDVPGAGEFKGLTSQKTVIFSPNPATDTTAQSVTAVSAEAKAADRLHVQFSSKITAAAYKAAVTATTWNKANGYGIAINDKLVNVKDVKQVTDTTLEFILDTDLATEAQFTTAAATALVYPNDKARTGTHTRIEAGWAGATYTTSGSTTKNFLRDNVEHKITFPQNVGNVVLSNTTGNVKFILTDTSKPAVLGVTAKDQIGFTVRFTEAVDERSVEMLNKDSIAPGFLLDGKQVIVNPTATAGDVASAKASNKIIVNKLEVGNYNDTTGVDTRNLVNFELNSEFALGAGTHIIQIANVTDWAGDADPVQNTVVTDTFSFTVAVDIIKPVAQVITDSAEQWLVKYDKPVVSQTGKVASDIFKIKTGLAADAELVYGVDYKVFITDDSGVAGREVMAGDRITTASQNFLIEFTKDWTMKYNTKANPSKTYFGSTQNPYKVTLEGVRTLVGNAADKQELNVGLSYDGTSPQIVTATDVYGAADKRYTTNVLTASNGTTKSTAVTASGKEILVTFNEPVKVNSDGVHPAEGLTASQDQFLNSRVVTALTSEATGYTELVPTGSAAGIGDSPFITGTDKQGDLAQHRQAVQASTYEFVKGDQVISAKVSSTSVAANDKSFVLEPQTQLEAGEWTLYIRAISDDIGNTIATTSTKVTIVPSTVTTTGTQVAWAAFDDAKGTDTLKNIRVDSQYADYDVVYVKFTKVMKADGANGVGSTQNYVFRGQPLSTLGNDAQVHQGIKGVTNDWDGVTITVPKGTWNGTNPTGTHGEAEAPFSNFSAAFNVAENFVSAAGEKLSGAYEFELTDTATSTTNTLGAPATTTSNDGLNEAFEAIYVQNNAGTFGSTTKAAVINATAVDAGLVAGSTTINGKIDRVTLDLDKSVTIAKGTQVLVNGKKFKLSPDAEYNGKAPLFIAETAADEIDGTSTTGLTVTTTTGAVLIGQNSVIDSALPVVKSAAIANGKVKVTFTENISVTGAVPFSSYLQLQDAAGAIVTYSGTANASVIGSDYLEFELGTTVLTAVKTIDVIAIPGAGTSVVKDSTGNSVSQIGTAYVVGTVTAPMFEKDIVVTGIGTGGSTGTVYTGVTATGFNQTLTGTAAVTAKAGEYSFGPINTYNGYKVKFAQDNAATSTTVTAIRDTAAKEIFVTANFTGATITSAEVTAGLNTLLGTGVVTAPTTVETYATAPAQLTVSNGTAAAATTGTFKIAAVAEKSADLFVTVKETIGSTTKTYVLKVALVDAGTPIDSTIAGAGIINKIVTASATAGNWTVDGAVAGALPTFTLAKAALVAPATVTDTVTVTGPAATVVTYTVTVQ